MKHVLPKGSEVSRWGRLLAGLTWLAALIVLWPGGARASERAADLLAQVDAALNRYDTLQLIYDVQAWQPTGSRAGQTERLRISVRLQQDKRLIELLEPGAHQGLKILALSDTRMFVYLPQHRKIRRVVSLLDQQTLLGTAIRQADLHLLRYSDRYQATLERQTEQRYVLSLRLRAGRHSPYPLIELEVDRALMLPLGIRYRNDRGELLRTETRADYACRAGFCSPRQLQVVDHKVGGRRTTLELRSFKVNPPSFEPLSKRSLLPR